MNRIDREKKTVSKMIAIYCKRNHGTESLCRECMELQDYANERLENCVFGDEKPACNNCPVHCYKPAKREIMKKIMRFSGPKMLLRHPYLAILHLLDERKEAPKFNKKIRKKSQ